MCKNTGTYKPRCQHWSSIWSTIFAVRKHAANTWTLTSMRWTVLTFDIYVYEGNVSGVTHIIVLLVSCNVFWNLLGNRWKFVTRQTYNVTLRRVHEIIVAWKSNRFYIFLCVRARARACVCVGGGCWCMGEGVYLCACSLIYLACNARGPCCLRLLLLHRFFRHFLINGTIFGKNLLSIKCVFWFFCTHFYMKHFWF
jgi:hypothetical protein